MNERERVRGFYPDRSVYELELFRGTPSEWIEELEKVWIGQAVSRTDEMTLTFRQPYLNRIAAKIICQ